jgi:Protein of unknown function (DUF3024).
MAFTEIELKRIEKLAQAFLDKRRPPVHLRKELDLGYRVDGNSIIIFEIRPSRNNAEKTIENPVAKAMYIKKSNIWKVYWQRADLKWHGYEPDPEVNALEEFFKIVDEDEYCCFWG